MSTFDAGWEPTVPFQVVGESWADGRFVEAVAEAHGVPKFDYTTPMGADRRPLGKGGFKRHLEGMLYFANRGKVSRIVVVGDNDTDHSASIAAIRRAFQEAKGYPTPPVHPLHMGSNGRIGVGIVMLPGTAENGCLESLLLKSTLKNSTVAQCLEPFVECCQVPTTPKNRHDKFKVHCILAASLHDSPTLTITAIWKQAANPFDASAPEFKWIADFLKVAFAS